MSERGVEKRDLAQEAAKYMDLIGRLPGVYAANVRFGDDGELCEVHVLASSARGPKQIARDVQSALFASIGVWVDHRIISVAQMAGEPICPQSDIVLPAEAAVRLKYKGFSHTVEDGVYFIQVTLQHADEEYKGEAVCKNSGFQRPRAVARATLDAVHRFLESKELFSLIAVQSVQVSGCSVLITILEYLGDANGRLLIGAAQQAENEELSVIRSTLDALNRLFGRLVAARI